MNREKITETLEYIAKTDAICGEKLLEALDLVSFCTLKSLSEIKKHILTLLEENRFEEVDAFSNSCKEIQELHNTICDWKSTVNFILQRDNTKDLINDYNKDDTNEQKNGSDLKTFRRDEFKKSDCRSDTKPFENSTVAFKVNSNYNEIVGGHANSHKSKELLFQKNEYGLDNSNRYEYDYIDEYKEFYSTGMALDNETGWFYHDDDKFYK